MKNGQKIIFTKFRIKRLAKIAPKRKIVDKVKFGFENLYFC